MKDFLKILAQEQAEGGYDWFFVTDAQVIQFTGLQNQIHDPRTRAEDDMQCFFKKSFISFKNLSIMKDFLKNLS